MQHAMQHAFSGDSKPMNFLVRAPKDVVDKFKRLMSQRGLTFGEFLAELVENYD